MPLTRDAFEQQRAAAKAVERRAGRILAAVAVGLGIAQLVFIKWAERHLTHGQVTASAGAAFLVYIALVGVLLVRMVRRTAAARVRCPQCGVALAGMSERVAVATGHCDQCGGQIIA